MNGLLGLGLSLMGISGQLMHIQDFLENAPAAHLGVVLVKEVQSRHGNMSVGHAPLSPDYEDYKTKQGGPSDSPLLWTGETRDSWEARVMDDPSGDGKALIIGSELDKALWDELGTTKQPPRPVLLPSVMAHEDEIRECMGDIVASLFENSSHVLGSISQTRF